MFNIFMNFGVSGLNVVFWGFMMIGQNISNVVMLGYLVECFVYVEVSGQYISSGYMFQGVNIVIVQWQYSQYLSDQLNGVQMQGGVFLMWYLFVMQLNNYIGSLMVGILIVIMSYFIGMQNVVNSVFDLLVWQIVMSNVQMFVNQIMVVGQQYDVLCQSVNMQFMSIVMQINVYIVQIV